MSEVVAIIDHQGTIRDVVDDDVATVIAEHRKFDSFGSMSGNTLDFPRPRFRGDHLQ